MANHKSALKRARQSEKRRVRNRSGRSAVRKHVKQFEEAAAGEGDAKAMLPSVMSAIARASSKGFMPKRRASRKIARLSRRLNASI